MNKIIITITLILIPLVCSAQKQYKFDYAIETEITFLYKHDSIKKRVIYLTNSTDNSYFAELKSHDSLYFKINFQHHDKIYSNFLVLKSGIMNAEFVNLSCETIHTNKNRYKNATERYDFFMLEDTLIEQQIYAAYKLRNIESFKKRKRRGSGTNLYIIDKSTSFHLPFLTHPTAYEEWKIHKHLPKGLFKEKRHINFEEQDHSLEKLIEFSKIEKIFVIPKECDYFN